MGEGEGRRGKKDEDLRKVVLQKEIHGGG